jgi:hypothetical protein
MRSAITLIILFSLSITVHAEPLKRKSSLQQSAVIERVLKRDTSPLPKNYRYLKPRLSKSKTRAVTNQFQVTYIPSGQNTSVYTNICTGFTPEAQAAIQRATEIWSGFINSSVPITIEACMTPLGSNTLGISSSSFRSNNNTFYTHALADSLAGYELNPSGFDSTIVFSSDVNFYYSTDGNLAWNESDFLSVVLHELGHSLNFMGLADYAGGDGILNNVAIYDRFTEDLSGTPLTNYTSPSAALGSALTSNNLYFNAPHANAGNGGNRVKIYAPASWSDGSSYAHLDYDTFNNTAHDLMVYRLTDGEANHDPGDITLGILRDMGWTMADVTPVCTYDASADTTSFDYGGGSGTITIESTPNDCVNGNWIVSENLSWVSIDSTSQGSGSGVWSVDFSVSENSSLAHSGTISVSGGNSNVAIEQAGVVVTEPITKRMWQDEAYTYLESQAYLVTQSNYQKVQDYAGAIDYCDNLNLAGFSDWYLPNQDELETIVNPFNTPTISSIVNNARASDYWSSTPHPTLSTFAYFVDFSNGQTRSETMNFVKYVRCVREIKPFNPSIIMYLLQ